MESLYKCVYCLQEKPKTEFNVEHVIPKAFGRYKNSLTLHENQVCRECNSVFSKELETIIVEDSYESLLRVTNGVKQLHDGHILGDTRIEIQGLEGVFNGLKLRCVVDNNSPEKISFLPYPAIGIKTSDDLAEYEYFTLNDFPSYTQEMVGQLSGKTQPILAWSITEEEALELLYKKGYPNSISHKTISPLDFNTDDAFSTKLDLKMDIIFNRLIAKTAFNYFVYHEKREISLLSKFDPIRKFIRYGTPSDFIKIRHSIGKLENLKKKRIHTLLA